MNSNDSERLARILREAGLAFAEDEAHADVVIFNTCSVRAHAEDRVFGKIKDLVTRRREGSDVLIVITGCMAGRDKDGAIRRRLPSVDLFFATPDMIHLPRWIAEHRPLWNIRSVGTPDYLSLDPLRRSPIQASVVVQTGCNQFCSYCVVPYARGLEKNRSLRAILDEVHRAAENGIREITLLGQTVNSYQAKDPQWFSVDNPFQHHFAALLWELNQIDGIDRIHWTAPHPLHMHAQVIEALRLPKQLNYLHLPVQSGSNEVLRRMNRKYTREMYLELIQAIREARPTIAIGTDLIVGFSGETEAEFEETLSLYRLCDFDISYPAQYSPRSGTLAHHLFPDNVSALEKKRRWEAVQSLMEETTARKNRVYQNQILSVFVDGADAHGMVTGTSLEFKRVRAGGGSRALIGQIVPVKITQTETWRLIGSVMQSSFKVIR